MKHLFDCHCHLEDKTFDVDLKGVIERAQEKLSGLVCSGVDPADFVKVLSVCEKYPGFVHASLGVHPEYVDKLDEAKINDAISEIKKNQERIISVGEVGLDYFWHTKEMIRDQQKQMFIRFIDLAKELDKPLVVHIRTGKDKERNAYKDAFEILEREDARKVLLHMFGVKSLLERALSNGWYISTNGIVLSSKEHKKIAKAVPIDRLLLETDSPYLLPAPLKEQNIKRNEPVFVEYVARRVAEVREVGFEEICIKTTETAKKFFGI